MWCHDLTVHRKINDLLTKKHLSSLYLCYAPAFIQDLVYKEVTEKLSPIYIIVHRYVGHRGQLPKWTGFWERGWCHEAWRRHTVPSGRTSSWVLCWAMAIPNPPQMSLEHDSSKILPRPEVGGSTVAGELKPQGRRQASSHNTGWFYCEHYVLESCLGGTCC